MTVTQPGPGKDDCYGCCRGGGSLNFGLLSFDDNDIEGKEEAETEEKK